VHILSDQLFQRVLGHDVAAFEGRIAFLHADVRTPATERFKPEREFDSVGEILNAGVAADLGITQEGWDRERVAGSGLHLNHRTNRVRSPTRKRSTRYNVHVR